MGLQGPKILISFVTGDILTARGRLGVEGRSQTAYEFQEEKKEKRKLKIVTKGKPRGTSGEREREKPGGSWKGDGSCGKRQV